MIIKQQIQQQRKQWYRGISGYNINEIKCIEWLHFLSCVFCAIKRSILIKKSIQLQVQKINNALSLKLRDKNLSTWNFYSGNEEDDAHVCIKINMQS